MFRSARLKLTGWYLLIIMVISVAFSAGIYQFTAGEVVRFAKLQRSRYQQGIRPPPLLEPEIIEETQRRVLNALGIINIAIFVAAGTLGYLLAGRTLRPIKQMVDDQNRFISDASHELRTPLTALKANLEVNLRDKKLSLAQARTLIDESVGDVNNLQKLSDNLLYLSRYDMHRSQPHFEQVSLHVLTEEVVKKLQPLAHEKHMNISLVATPISLQADSDSIKQLMIILIDNAIKYGNTETTIEVLLESTDHHATLSVINQGVGIPKKDLPRIFDRFYRSDISRTRSAVMGHGLGLSIAQKIVQEHKGVIVAQSVPDQKTTFKVRLPLKSGFSWLSAGR